MFLYIVAALLYAVTCEEYILNFSETPSNVSVLRYQNILLRCRAQGNIENVLYRWKHNGKELQVSGRRRLINGNLFIKRASESVDEGEYICELSHMVSGQSISSPAAVVHVHWLESNVSVALVYPEHVSRISLGGEIDLQCLAYGSAGLKIDWSRNGERLTKSDRISLEGNRLHIKNLTPTDNGVYRCLASNGAGSSLSLKNFALAIQNDTWATIQVIPEDKIVKEGTSARIDCVYRNADVMEWYFQEKIGPLDNTTRFTVLSSNGSLIVNNMTKIEEGEYSCVGIKQDSADVPQKYTARLYVAALASMNSTFLDPEETNLHVVPEGKNFEIRCYPPFGKPPPVMKWRKSSNQPIGSSGRIRVDGYTLSVNKANAKSDAGTYTCRAENLAGFQEVSFNLVVAVPPVIKSEPVSKIEDEGANVTMSCKYSGTPYPVTRVLWFKDEIPVPINTSRTFVDVANGTLWLTGVDLNDAGNYYCVVNTSSVEPVTSRYATLNIQQKLKFHPLPMGKKKMELGMANKIPCKAVGKDVPTVRWIKGNSANNEVPFPKHVQDLNGTLHFAKVQKQDEGQYTCIASNSQGEISVVIDVSVVVTPKFTILPKNPTEGFEGFPVRLDCVAEGDPTPTIQWDNKNVDFSQKRFHVLPNGSLIIDELHLSDDGLYGCTAGNSGGFNRTEVALIVRSSENLRSDGTIDGIEGDTVGRTVVITLGAACAYILLVIILMAWCRYRRRRKKQSYMDANMDNPNVDEDPGTGKYSSRNPVELKETVVIQNGDSICIREDGQNATNSLSSSRSKRSADGFEHLSFSRKNIHNIMLLGKGEFGSVYLAQNSQNSNAVVMVKVLEEIKEEFKRQLDILTRVDHEHLVKLVGLCREMQPHYMILEYTDWGDLKQFLIATRKSSVGVVGNKERPTPLTVKQSLNIAKQVASALERLSSKNYTHRDVAARNCLITSALNVKVTFSSLCKTTYAAEYYVMRNQILPIRWLPLEAVAEDKFTSAADVYSFACLVWEIFTKGELPFSKVSNKDFVNLLEKEQAQWKLPKSMPAKLGQLLHKCWSLTPTDRPLFSQIVDKITELMNLVNNE